MVQVVDLSPCPGKGRPAPGELQQTETAHSERQSLYALTAEAPPQPGYNRRHPKISTMVCFPERL